MTHFIENRREELIHNIYFFFQKLFFFHLFVNRLITVEIEVIKLRSIRFSKVSTIKN